ncbi:M23 family metallopeptidase [Galbibacter sp. CMA-7]|uniref:M23 family metallopeptidase n=2 Tax=Galbibacter pacificus TaxID=2996052 RepID=A0ABT6FR00_9FLAO|nr:M23 family metallopeptidase [Galbibacter pacificus]
MKLDNDGKTAVSDRNKVTDWYGYNADVLAVSDGEVAAIETGFRDSKYIDQHPKHNASNATGNYIALDIGNGNYVFYEHLKFGSIRVKTGQKVKKGDVIASLGFTGQATGPHLHFHVANANSPLGAEGVPFEFEEYTVLGVYNDFDDFGKVPWDYVKKLSDSILKNDRPAPNTVIKFE